MKRKASMLAKRIICILLCILMLPLVKASAAGYNDAYKALVSFAKTGSPHNDGKYNYYLIWDDRTIHGNEFSIQFYSPVGGQGEDYIVILCDDTVSSARSGITLFFMENEPNNVLLIFGTQDNYAEATINSSFSLNSDLRFDYREGSMSDKAFKQEFKKYIKYVFEYVDLTLHTKDSKLSIQDIFKNISPKSLHNFSKSWVEKAETCTADGTMGYQCSACGVKYYEPIKAHHNWQLVEEIVPATDVHGSGFYKCNRCNETKTDEICISGAFTDMPAYDNWAHPGIDWAVFKGITNGTSSTTFSPGQGCTRGQVVTFLWRAAGSPEPESMETPFQDLKPGAFYEKAVAWAVEQEITSGTSQTQFSPDGTCTRGQIVTFLWRFKGSPEVSEVNTNFHDVKLGAFYEKAVGWAASTGVTSGTSETTFSPDNTCTRAQVVTFLHRAQ